MDLQLKDEVVVVVGAASGIGRATACEFLAEGARVCWLDKSPEVHRVAQETHGRAVGSPLAWEVDATDSTRMQQVASQVMNDCGRCDHVVVSIGLPSGKFGFPFWNLQPADWEDVVRVTLLGVVHVVHAFVPHMLPRRRGSFCLLSSIAGQIGSQTDPPYSAAKAGVINFAQCAAKDLAPYNIRVNVVSPGMVKTALNRAVWEAWRRASPEHQQSYERWAADKIEKNAPLGRWQQPEDVAAMITFLASHRAENITGQTLNVDGGQVMHA